MTGTPYPFLRIATLRRNRWLGGVKNGVQ